MLTRRVYAMTTGDTIGISDMALRRAHLASVIVSSDSCRLVALSTSAMAEILKRREDMVAHIARLALAAEHRFLDDIQCGERPVEHGAAREAAALCSSAVFLSP